MSIAPQSLKDLRAFFAEQTGKPAGNFSIRSVCGTRRNRGYHLGKSDIYSACGLKDKDYSVQRPRDKAGLSEAASAIDIKLPVKQLKAMTAWLEKQAKAGKLDVQEFIGPGPDGRAYDWRKGNKWNPVGPRAKGDSHEWHVHVSFPRDTEFKNRINMFRGFFGTEVPVDPTPPPAKPTADEVRLWQTRLNVHGASLTVDGLLGPKTEAAIKAFQQANGLTVSGTVDAATLAALLADPEPEVPEEPEPPAPSAEELLRQKIADLKEELAAIRDRAAAALETVE